MKVSFGNLKYPPAVRQNQSSSNPQSSRARSSYENPVNRRTEKGLAVLSNFGGSLLGGLTAAGLASCFLEGGIKSNKKLLGGITAGVTAVLMALTLPAKLYNTKVQSFAREKEMDVFTRDRSLQSNIMEEVDKNVMDPEENLDNKIRRYTSVQMAKNGNGVLIKGMP